jgi:DNA-binding MarR family transcriptional regulator
MARRSTISNDDAFALLVADVFDAAGVFRRYGELVAGTAGQTQARWQLMSVVSEGDWTVPMAADRLGTSRQAVQRIANELVDEGLAIFTENPHHQRSPFLHLTRRGANALTQITLEARRRERARHTGLSTSDLDAARSVLREMTAIVRSELAHE